MTTIALVLMHQNLASTVSTPRPLQTESANDLKRAMEKNATVGQDNAGKMRADFHASNRLRNHHKHNPAVKTVEQVVTCISMGNPLVGCPNEPKHISWFIICLSITCRHAMQGLRAIQIDVGVDLPNTSFIGRQMPSSSLSLLHLLTSPPRLARNYHIRIIKLPSICRRNNQ